MAISGNLVNAYYICPRKTWLYAHSVYPETNFNALAIGRLISEESYKRDKKEVEFENLKFDLVRASDGTVVVGEVKKSSKGIEAARKQVLFYLLKLKESGVTARGEILVPAERRKEDVMLSPDEETCLNNDIEKIGRLISADAPPAAVKIGYCRNCAYNDFCWAEMTE
jgi:CRISPR-associated protein Cas4